jgi:transposase
MSNQYSTHDLDHLGIVAGVCQQIDLIEQIDARVPATGRKVSVGQAVQAMVLNGLGFVGRALYLTPEFYRTKPLDLLIGDEIEADDLNSDSLGKALDQLYAAGITEIFAAVSTHALRRYGIAVKFAHLDTTAFSLQGDYEEAEREDDGEPQPITITYGHSKDHRPDLKQAIMGLICVNQTCIPAYLSAVSGNVSDKTSMPEMAQTYLDQFGADETMPVLVADSALYSAETIRNWSQGKWVTRVPATITEAKHLLAETRDDHLHAAERAGYFYTETTSEYGGVEQRWLVVLYEPRRDQEQRRLDKRITREYDQLGKQAKQLTRQVFNCQADAQQALDRFAQPWAWHMVTGELVTTTRYAQPGRPTSNSAVVTEWHLQITYEPDEQAIAQQQHSLGKYIIATNELDPTRLSTADLLTVYKDQNTSVERGFRFLKDPLFFAHRLFLKKPARIMGLLMVMGLSLLIYALAEHHLRQQLAVHDETIPDQKGKPTQRPTMRRVFQMFEGIHVLTIWLGERRQRLVTNVQAVHLQIATLLGEPILKFYTFEEMTL